MAETADLLKRLPPRDLALLERVASTVHGHGASPYLVGGTVRDLMLGLRPADLDISAEGASSELIAAAARELGGRVHSHSQFNTWKLAIDGSVIDIAMTRRESYSHPGALPAVSSGSLQEDLSRRDFSINAMAISLSGPSRGRLIDPLGGERDVQEQRIRVLHQGSFVDDATRILRAVRYAGRLAYGLEAETEGRVRDDSGYLSTITADRIRHELQRILREVRVRPIMRLARDLSVLQAIHPGLMADDKPLAELDKLADEPADRRELLAFALLACSTPSDQTPALIARLNLDAAWSRVARDCAGVKEALGALSSRDARPSEVYALLRPFDVAAVKAAALVESEPPVVGNLNAYLEKLRHVRPLLTGDDVLAMGVPGGPEVGRLLHDLLVARLDGLATSRSDEERIVSSHLRKPAP